MVSQNLFLCLLLSAMAGLFTIAGKVVVLHLARRRKALRQQQRQQQEEQLQLQQQRRRHQREGSKAKGNDNDVNVVETGKKRQHTKNLETYIMMACFVVANIIANGCIFIAPWFGPVSVYWPAYVASQLLANMLVVGTLLQHERFDKSAQVATLMVVAAVLFITIVGPGGQPSTPSENQDIKSLVMDNWLAIGWLSLLCLVFFVSLLAMIYFMVARCTRQRLGGASAQQSSNDSMAGTCFSTSVLEMVLLLVSITCSALSATASKAASTLTSPDDATIRYLLIALSWGIIICWSVENYLEGRHVRSLGRFLPAVTLGSIILNAISGLIVWKDGETVQSWAGYVTALCLLGMGVYLISDLDFFKAQIEEQQDYQRQIETWRDLFSILEEDLTLARVEQSLSRHQRTINSDHLRLGGLPRGNSDPELGTRTNGQEFFPNLPTVNTSYMAPPRSTSSIDSLLSLSTMDRSMASPPQTRGKRLPSSTSATVRTLESLERLSATIRNSLADKEHPNGSSFRNANDYGGATSDSDRSSLELSISNHKTGQTFSGTVSDISGHSRDSSIVSMNDLTMNENDVIQSLGIGENAPDLAIPPPPPSSRKSPYRSMTSPYRSRKHHYVGTMTMKTSGMSPTISKILRKAPSRSQSLESLTEDALDEPPPALRETDEDG